MEINLVHLITDLDVGGAETTLYRLLRQVDRRRFTPSVVSLMDRGTLGDRIEALGVQVHTVGMRRPILAPFKLPRLWRILRTLRPDLLHCWMYHANLLGAFMAPAVGVKTVVWGLHHSSLDPQLDKRTTILVAKAGAWLSRRVDGIVSCSKTGLAFHRSLGYQPERMRFIPNGFDVERFHPDPRARAEVRQELGLTQDSVLIGLAARFHPYKDHGNFFLAARRLLDDLGPKPLQERIRFVLCGKNVVDDNPEIMEYVRRLGLSDRVHLLGERSDVHRIMAALDIVTSSSKTEAFPNAVGEAMACGVPCVVTDVGDSADIVEGTGVVVPPRDPQGLANGWRRLLELEPEQLLKLGAAARRRIEENYSLASVVRAYENLYEELLVEKANKYEKRD